MTEPVTDNNEVGVTQVAFVRMKTLLWPSSGRHRTWPVCDCCLEDHHEMNHE